MVKINQIKARKKRGSIEGLAYLYQSMLRYYDNLSRSEIEDICYNLYVAYIDTLRWEFPKARFEEKRRREFLTTIRERTAYYQTSVQFYKSLEFVLNHINEVCLKTKQLQIYQKMRRFLEEKLTLFHMLTGLSLHSSATVYHACSYSLLPSSNEPRRVFASGYAPWRTSI